ncbi:MAG: PEP-CTERM sorting domain-containing protein [Akkermansia sp.]
MKPYFLILTVVSSLVGMSHAASLVKDQDTMSISGNVSTITIPPSNTAGEYISFGSDRSGARDSSIALSFSNIAQSTNATDKQGLVFFNTSSYANLAGIAYNYTGTNLTISVGGFNEAWESFVINDFSETSSLSLFFDHDHVVTSAGHPCSFYYSVDGGDIVDPSVGFSDKFGFGTEKLTSISVGNKQTGTNNNWANNPSGGGQIGAIAQGDFTLDWLKGYDQNLTDAEKKELVSKSIPEPTTASLALLGLASLVLMRRRQA